MLSLLRDKIYQFQIFEFLKVLFDQNSTTIEVVGTISIDSAEQNCGGEDIDRIDCLSLEV